MGELVREYVLHGHSRVAQPGAHDADVVGRPGILGDTEGGVGEEGQARGRGLRGERGAHILRGAEHGDDDGGASAHAQGGEPWARLPGRGQHGRGAAARPAIGEDEEPGALQHDRIVQRHQVAAPEVLRRLVRQHDDAVGYAVQPEIPRHSDPVRRTRSAELPDAPDPVDAGPRVDRRDREGERPPRQRRQRVEHLGQTVARLLHRRPVPSSREPLDEALAVTGAQRVGGAGEAVAGELQGPRLVCPWIVVRGAQA